MNILRVEIARMDLGLRAPYTLASGTIDAIANVFVQIVTDGPHVGLGCAAPAEEVTGETVDHAEAALRAAAPGLVGVDALARTHALAAVDTALAGAPAARAALDMALFDLLGKAAGLPVATLLGGHRRSIPTSITVCIGGVDAMVAEARGRLQEGFRAIKLKGGADPDHDVAVIRRTRAAVGPDVGLRFDANMGYDAPTALDVLARVADCDLEFVEQPTPRGGLLAVARATPMAVMADESLLDLADALHLAAGDRADLVNLKLMKVGGIEAALAVNAVARAASFEAMVGCMDESALAISAGLALALGRPNVDYADLDGHLDLLDDPAADLLRLEDGVLHPAPGPGLGLRRLPVFEGGAAR